MPRWTRWVVPAAAAAVIAALLTSDRAPRLPRDVDHEIGQAETRCLSCHHGISAHARPADHPRRDDCYSCHADDAGKLHPHRGAATSLPGGWADDPRL